MSLYKNWQDFLEEERTEEEYNKFWDVYFKKEKDVYGKIISSPSTVIEGTLTSLANDNDMTPITFTGFIDGINSSLVEKLNLETLTEDSNIKLSVDFEKLYYNMLVAQADWLYTLPEWDNVLTGEKIKSIKKEYNKTKTVVNENKIGRNDPCPCGSGKKYKKCCLNK